MFTYVGLIKLTPDGRENLPKAPEYLDKITKIVEAEGGHLEKVFAMMGPWDFFAIVQYPEVEAAFRALAKIGQLEVVQTETFPVEEVELFLKTFV
jgi:uncharacterized protein with GYD domain